MNRSSSSDVNKDLGFKAKDLGFKAKTKAKDLSFKAKAKDLRFKAKDLTQVPEFKAKDLRRQGPRTKAKDTSQGWKILGSFRKFPGKFPETWKVSTASFRKVTWKFGKSERKKLKRNKEIYA